MNDRARKGCQGEGSGCGSGLTAPVVAVSANAGVDEGLLDDAGRSFVSSGHEVSSR